MVTRTPIAAIVAAVGLQACSSEPVPFSPTSYRAKAAPGEPSLEEIRAASERFKDVKVALAEGYRPDPMNHCVTAENMGRNPALGGMGIHYGNPELLGISGPPNPKVSGTGTHTDFRRPAVLIYEPQQDGSLQLIAVENLVFEDAWKAAGNAAPPRFHGRPYDRMEDDPSTSVDEAHMFVAHYDRHIWVHRPNKNGVFTPFNPAVTCKHHRPKVGS